MGDSIPQQNAEPGGYGGWNPPRGARGYGGFHPPGGWNPPQKIEYRLLFFTTFKNTL